MQTAAGLAAAHAQGLVHRDIKPSNILLENGVERVKLTDFGLARAVDDASLTQSGVVAGTPLFMAPEQARCETIDHRADLFSLGAVLYAMCTGRSPFRASTTLGVLRRVSDDAAPARPRGESRDPRTGWPRSSTGCWPRTGRSGTSPRPRCPSCSGRHLARRQRGQVDDREPERVEVQPTAFATEDVGPAKGHQSTRLLWIAVTCLLLVLAGVLVVARRTEVVRNRREFFFPPHRPQVSTSPLHPDLHVVAAPRSRFRFHSRSSCRASAGCSRMRTGAVTWSRPGGPT